MFLCSAGLTRGLNLRIQVPSMSTGFESTSHADTMTANLTTLLLVVMWVYACRNHLKIVAPLSSDIIALATFGPVAFFEPTVACIVFVLLISIISLPLSLDSQRWRGASWLARNGRGLGQMRLTGIVLMSVV